jgi:uncharacterized membrane protein
MRNSFYRFLLLPACLVISSGGFAQNNQATESVMRSNGKIYVVVAICLTILIGLFLYLVSIDRKITRIENKQ